jgi:hypothetical protein
MKHEANYSLFIRRNRQFSQSSSSNDWTPQAEVIEEAIQQYLSAKTNHFPSRQKQKFAFVIEGYSKNCVYSEMT